MKYFTVTFFVIVCVAAMASGNQSTNSHSRSSSSDEQKLLSPMNTSAGIFFKGDKHIKFNLYNKYQGVDKPHKLKFDSIMESDWVNKEWKTVFFIHGFFGRNFPKVIKEAYLLESNYSVNLIEVNWFNGAKNPFYSPSANRVQRVGKIVSKFIALNQDKIDLEKLAIVGHSLGAQASGFAGKFLQQDHNLTLPLIIGLDPAGPRFNGKRQKLQPEDAKDVLVIHTSHLFGHFEPLGTVDVYLNGGMWQPGCTDAQSHSYAKIFYKQLINGKEPLIGHRYSSFDEVKRGIIPETNEIKIFHRDKLPSKGTLIHINTEDQQDLLDEVEKYLERAENKRLTHCCHIM